MNYDTHPYWLRLAVDIDPTGHPLGFHCTLFQDGKDAGTMFLAFPGPFDTLEEACQALVMSYGLLVGRQLDLF